MYKSPRFESLNKMPQGTSSSSFSIPSTMLKSQRTVSTDHAPPPLSDHLQTTLGSDRVVPAMTSNNRQQTQRRQIQNTINAPSPNNWTNSTMEYNVPTAVHPSLPSQKRKRHDIRETKFVGSQDNSLRVITTSIQGMKYWSQQKFSFPIIFEIYGTLASQVTNIKDNLYIKEFYLQDKADRIRCLFAEMDRSFVPAGRDLQIRIICRFEQKKHGPLARCISVRLAHDNEVVESLKLKNICQLKLKEELVTATAIEQQQNSSSRPSKSLYRVDK